MNLKELIDYLIREGYLQDERVKEAMLYVDRKIFMPKEYKDYSYEDNAFPIGYGQTISAPSVVAKMLSELKVEKGMKILEIGAGSGYNAALLGYLVGEKGKVYSIERIKEVAEIAKENLKKAGIKNVEIIIGDGSIGYPKESPYDRVLCTAALPELPENHPLILQLKKEGILVAPVGRFGQDLIVYDGKTGKRKKVLPVVFVPLIGKYGFQERTY